MSRSSIYFAAPLFNENERDFNQAVVAKLDEFADVFLPQRNGSLLVEMIGAGVSPGVAEARVFSQDIAAIRRSDLLVAVLDGAHIDEGVAFELGFASAIGCVCVGLQTDVRRSLGTGNNPMISGGLQAIFSESQTLVAWLRNWAMSASYANGAA